MIADIIILFFNLLIYLITGVITWLVNILPVSPFASLDFSVPSEWLSYLNYFVPVNLMLPVLASWATCLAGYKFITWLMHILKIQ